jgi:hypothetical protein
MSIRKRDVPIIIPTAILLRLSSNAAAIGFRVINVTLRSPGMRLSLGRKKNSMSARFCAGIVGSN